MDGGSLTTGGPYRIIVNDWTPSCKDNRSTKFQMNV
jgi:hypothetical protein